MKISNNFKAISKAFIGLLVLSVGLTSCSKKFDGEPLRVAGISFINASPVEGEFDVVVGSSKANEDPFTYGIRINYLGLYPGRINVGLTKKGENNFILNRDGIFESGKAYSLFLVDVGANRTYLKIEDNLTVPEGTKTKVRFVNTSPDSSPLNFGLHGQPQDLATNKAYKEFSDFVEIESGENLSFDIKDTATKNVLAKIENIKLEKGKIYTFYARGLKTLNGAAESYGFGALFFEHK